MKSLRVSRAVRAAAELELRRRQRERGTSASPPIPFRPWLESASPAYRWDWPHLVLLQDQLERVTRKEIDRLLVSMPPRHGKSETATVRYPVYRLERDPTLHVIVAAYNQALAERFSRKARKIASERLSLSKDRATAGDWETASGGSLRAAGVGAGVTGHGGNLILIDDPVKSREEANSQAYRDKVWDWYTDDLLTRVEPGGAIVLVMTRWHEDDLAGRILRSEDASNWVVVNLPALAEPDDPLGREVGQALCPDRYDVPALERIRRNSPSTFTALYQGHPSEATGNRFRREWFRYHTIDGDLLRLHSPAGVKVVPLAHCRRFGTLDLANSLKKEADYTAAAVWAVTPDADLVLLDMVRARLEDPDIPHLVVNLTARHGLSYWGVESNGLGLGIVQACRRRSVAVRAIVADRDKVSRSSTAVIRYEAGQVYHPQSAAWLADFELELLQFPKGPHDDQVDAVSMGAIDAFRMGSAHVDDEAQPEPAERARVADPTDDDEWDDDD